MGDGDRLTQLFLGLVRVFDACLVHGDFLHPAQCMPWSTMVW
jgi:hypothetical protein